MNQADEHLHFIGILGSGMNAVAQLAVHRGRCVSGSDRFLDQTGNSHTAVCLEKLGVRLTAQDGSGIDGMTGAVVVSSAIEADNPDLVAARKRGLPVLHRADALVALLGSGRLIGVAGTSGKTTVTGMLGWILTELGMEPTVVNGDALVDWRNAGSIGNARFGTGPWQVIELDESDRSLLRFHPEWAIITNITADHFSEQETRGLFQQFRRQISRGAIGALDAEPDSSGTDQVSIRLSVPGNHNIENARQCLALCRRLGCDMPRVIEALSRFKGIARRLERITSSNSAGCPAIYDDFAHNPAKIAAAINAIRPVDGQLTAVWQPHGFRPLAQMFDDLSTMFVAQLRPSDRLLLLPVYYAGGTTQRTVTSADLAARLRRESIQASAVNDWSALTRILTATPAGAHDTILMMGARDPTFAAQVRRMALQMKTGA